MAFNLPLGSVGIATNPEPGTYPYIHGQQTEAGHMFILDDTPNNEQIIIQHAKSNTQVWFEPDGSMQTTIAGNNFTVVVNNNNVVIEGVCNIQVYADAKLEVRGSVFAQVNENLTAIVKGDSSVVSDGNLEVSAGKDINVTAGTGLSSINPVTAPNIYLNTGNSVVVNGDLTVAGAIRVGNSLTAGENVIAGLKLFSYGGIDTLGGINVGYTLPTPINPGGYVAATVSVAAPTFFGAFGNIGFVNTIMVRDALGSLAKLRATYDTHTHPDAGVVIPPDFGEGPAATTPGFTAPFTAPTISA